MLISVLIARIEDVRMGDGKWEMDVVSSPN